MNGSQLNQDLSSHMKKNEQIRRNTNEFARSPESFMKHTFTKMVSNLRLDDHSNWAEVWSEDMLFYYCCMLMDKYLSQDLKLSLYRDGDRNGPDVLHSDCVFHPCFYKGNWHLMIYNTELQKLFFVNCSAIDKQGSKYTIDSSSSEGDISFLTNVVRLGYKHNESGVVVPEQEFLMTQKFITKLSKCNAVNVLAVMYGICCTRNIYDYICGKKSDYNKFDVTFFFSEDFYTFDRDLIDKKFYGEVLYKVLKDNQDKIREEQSGGASIGQKRNGSTVITQEDHARALKKFRSTIGGNQTVNGTTKKAGNKVKSEEESVAKAKLEEERLVELELKLEEKRLVELELKLEEERLARLKAEEKRLNELKAEEKRLNELKAEQERVNNLKSQEQNFANKKPEPIELEKEMITAQQNSSGVMPNNNYENDSSLSLSQDRQNGSSMNLESVISKKEEPVINNVQNNTESGESPTDLNDFSTLSKRIKNLKYFSSSSAEEFLDALGPDKEEFSQPEVLDNFLDFLQKIFSEEYAKNDFSACKLMCKDCVLGSTEVVGQKKVYIYEEDFFFEDLLIDNHSQLFPVFTGQNKLFLLEFRRHDMENPLSDVTVNISIFGKSSSGKPILQNKFLKKLVEKYTFHYNRRIVKVNVGLIKTPEISVLSMIMTAFYTVAYSFKHQKFPINFTPKPRNVESFTNAAFKLVKAIKRDDSAMYENLVNRMVHWVE